MPPRRSDPAEHAAPPPPESYASIWSELSEAQRAAILAAINSTDTDPRPTAAQETMQALRRVLLDKTLVSRPAGEPGDSTTDLPAPGAGWGWRPADNLLVSANFDPALIVGGNAPEHGVLVCQRVIVPAGATVSEILLDVVTPGSDLTTGTAAVYEADGAASGFTGEQARAWSTAALHRMELKEAIEPRAEPRAVWVAFIADGGAVPGFAVPWISRAARPNAGLPSPGPQRAGELTARTTCPDSITPAEMRPGQQYWVGLG